MLVVETVAKIGPKAPMISGKKVIEVPVADEHGTNLLLGQSQTRYNVLTLD